MHNKNKLSRLSIDVPVELQKKLKALAAIHGKSMRTIVTELITKLIEECTEPNK